MLEVSVYPYVSQTLQFQTKEYNFAKMDIEGVPERCIGGSACHGDCQAPQICSVEELNKYVDKRRIHWKCEYTAMDEVS